MSLFASSGFQSEPNAAELPATVQVLNKVALTAFPLVLNVYKRLYEWGGTDVTILYFYEPSCGHCRKTMPKVGEFAKKYANDPRIKVKVASLSMRGNREFIHSINNVYICDEK